MDPEDMYNALLGALTEHHKKLEEDAPRIGSMMPIAPFEAETDDGDHARVVGIVTNPGADVLDFVVVKTLSGGELIATTEGSVWAVKKEEAA